MGLELALRWQLFQLHMFLFKHMSNIVVYYTGESQIKISSFLAFPQNMKQVTPMFIQRLVGLIII